MELRELNKYLRLVVPDIKSGYLAAKRIGKGGVGEGVYRCRNPRIVLKLQYTLREFKRLHDSGAMSNGMFPKVYKLVTDHDRYADFPYHLLWRESCRLPPLKNCKHGWARGYTYEHFETPDDALINEARRLTSVGFNSQIDWDADAKNYKLPKPWRTAPPPELVYLQADIQSLKANPDHWTALDSCSTDVHLYNFGFVYRGRGKKRTRRIVFFDPVVH